MAKTIYQILIPKKRIEAGKNHAKNGKAFYKLMNNDVNRKTKKT